MFASKPLGLTLKDGWELKKVVEEAKPKFMVNYEFRYSPIMQAIRRQIEAGAIGNLSLMWWNMFRMPFRPAYAKGATSGGAFVANPSRAHPGHLGFDVSHRRFAQIILKDLEVNKEEARRGFESLLISIAAQQSSDQGRIITREDALADMD